MQPPITPMNDADEPTPEEMSAAIDAAADFASRNWGWFLGAGIVSVVFGLAVLLWPTKVGATVLEIMIAFFLLYTGFIDLITSRRWPSRWLGVTFGVISILAGIAALVEPTAAVTVIAAIFGACLVLYGLVRIVGSLVTRARGWGWSVAIGVVSLVIGTYALADLSNGVSLLIFLLGIEAVFWGGLEIIAAFGMKRAKDNVDEIKRDLGV